MDNTKKTIIYLNLTNGIEAIDFFPDAHFVRIQSSHCESKAFNAMFMQLSDDFLYNLSQGNKVVIIDGGVNEKFPKAIRQGVDVILSFLQYAWFEESIQDQFHQKVWKSIDDATKTRLRYYKKLLNTDKIYLLPLGFSTNNDGDYSFYAEKLKNISFVIDQGAVA